jgi:hypothetical protein
MANKLNGFGLQEKLDREMSYAMLISRNETISIVREDSQICGSIVYTYYIFKLELNESILEIRFQSFYSIQMFWINVNLH